MAEKSSVTAVPKTCLYECDGLSWELLEGTAPPGYYCPPVLGSCEEPGEEMWVSPLPIRNMSLSSTEAGDATSVSSFSNFGHYEFDRDTDSLYFSSGVAEKGFRFLPKISLSELREKFPAIAAEIETLKNAKSLVGFTVQVPAMASGKRA